jgi:hypothetical protein
MILLPHAGPPDHSRLPAAGCRLRLRRGGGIGARLLRHRGTRGCAKNEKDEFRPCSLRHMNDPC